MRHRLAGRKLSRTSAHRKALRRNLAAALFQHGRIKTTMAKAKYVQRFAEKIITIARRGDLSSRRRIISLLQDRFLVDQEETDIVRNNSWQIVKGPRLVSKLFGEIAGKYTDRPGGYTRIIRLNKPRLGDNGQQVYLELIDPEKEKKTKRTRTGGDRRRKAQIRYQAVAVLKQSKSGKKKTKTSSKKPAETQASEQSQQESSDQPAQDQEPQQQTKKVPKAKQSQEKPASDK